VVHADVNAAFNIASAPFRQGLSGIMADMEKQRVRPTGKKMQKSKKGMSQVPVPVAGAPLHGSPGNLLYILESQHILVQCTPS
jgi:hypothetical protein